MARRPSPALLGLAFLGLACFSGAACGGETTRREDRAGRRLEGIGHVAHAVDAGLAPEEPPSKAATNELAPILAVAEECMNDAGHPVLLHCTGLYARWPGLALGSDVREFDPGLHLWSDGASKRRFIWLPPGKLIDTRDMDEWVFPEGTKLWKEFSLNGKRVETRYLEKRTDGSWFRTTYAWSPDQTTAVELTTGQRGVWGTTYEIPSRDACTVCHQGRIDGVLGFEAISLSTPMATGVTLEKLLDAGLLTNMPPPSLAIPGNADERAALGWLHANCGISCHNRSPSATAGNTGLFMRLTSETLSAVPSTDTWTTAVGVVSTFQPIAGETFLRIKPRDVAKSLIPFRDGTRDDADVQMPPIGTHQVDPVGLALVKTWINRM